MRRFFVGFVVAILFVGSASGVEPAVPNVDRLVVQLGSPSFAEREAAGRDLGRRPEAIAALTLAAADHPDPEVRARASRLVDHLQRVAASAKAIAVTPVSLDLVDVPLTVAVAALKAKTGIPVVLDPAGVDLSRRVTVRIESLRPWEAVDAFATAAGLREVFRHELGGTAVAAQMKQRIAAMTPAPGHDTAGTVPVVFTDGKVELLPGDRSTAVRVLALPANFPANRVVGGAGQVVFHLDVTPLPGLKWDEVTGVRIFRAEDEAGRPITGSHAPETRTSSPFDDLMFNGLQAQQIVLWNLDGLQSGGNGPRPNPRVVPVTLQTDDRRVTGLRIFEGVVVGEVTVTNQTLMAFEDLAKAIGTVAASGETRVSVIDYRVLADGRTAVKVRTEGPNPWTRGRRGVQMNNLIVWDGPTPPGANPLQLRFADAAGNPLPTPLTQSANSTDDGLRQTNEAEYLFPARTPPIKLSAIGSKPLTIEVPFRLRNVRLP